MKHIKRLTSAAVAGLSIAFSAGIFAENCTIGQECDFKQTDLGCTPVPSTLAASPPQLTDNPGKEICQRKQRIIYPTPLVTGKSYQCSITKLSGQPFIPGIYDMKDISSYKIDQPDELSISFQTANTGSPTIGFNVVNDSRTEAAKVTIFCKQQ